MNVTYRHYYGVSKEKIGKISLILLAFAFALTAVLTVINRPASAGHNGADVSISGGACEATTFTATITDPSESHQVGNMRLIVDDGVETQVSDPIPTNGSSVEIEVGPFGPDTTVSWRVFGGGERDYDQPLWNDYGGPTFNADVAAYGTANGFGFVVAGVDDPNPFTTWNEVPVEGCSPETKDECKKGEWEAFGFRNQGLCIQYVNTGKDSR
jgi:hypothetical protein